MTYLVIIGGATTLYIETLQQRTTMKLIAENQLVGTGDGYAHFRNLYDTDDTVTGRASVPTSKSFNCNEYRHLTTTELRKLFIKGVDI